VDFSQDIRDIAPGQYAVFYQGDEMLGGGMIQSVDNINV
jgi:tRNA-specific 2-thiouridylase